MNTIQHVNVKLYLEKEIPNFDEELVIPIFHKWIQEKKLEEVWIDVATYAHVPFGPGVVLVSHDAIYSLEPGPEGRIGLLYNRRTVHPTTSSLEVILSALEKIKAAQALLEMEELKGGIKLKFSSNEFKFFVNDRLIAPNHISTFKKFEGDIGSAFEKSWGKKYKLSYKDGDSRDLFHVALSHT